MKKLKKKHILSIVTIATIGLFFPFFNAEASDGISYYVSGYANNTQITFLNGQHSNIDRIKRGDGDEIHPYTSYGACQTINQTNEQLYTTCTHSYTGTNASGEYLVEIIPNNTFVDWITYLDLSNANITRLDSFGGAPALQNLNLSHNEIASRNYDAFSGLTSLSTLDLSYNNITNINGSKQESVGGNNIENYNPFYNTLMSSPSEQPRTIKLNNNPIQDIAAFLPNSIISGQGYGFNTIFTYTHLKLNNYTIELKETDDDKHQTIEINSGLYVSHEVVKENSGYTRYAYNYNYPADIGAEYKIDIVKADITQKSLTGKIYPNPTAYQKENGYYTSLPKFHITESQICENLRAKNIIDSEEKNLNIKFDEITILPSEPINITVSYPIGEHEKKTYQLTCPAVSNTYSLTIHYLFSGLGTRATGDYEDLNLEDGEHYSVDSPIISGYTATPPIVSGTITGNTEITVRYTQNSNNPGNGGGNGSGTENPNNPGNGGGNGSGNGGGNLSNQTYSLEVYYVYTSNKIISQVNLQITGGSTYFVRAPTPEYYTPTCTNCTIDQTTTGIIITGIMPNNEKIIIVRYKPNKDDNTNEIADEEETYTLTINHVYSNGSGIDTVSKQVLSGATYTGKILNISGYTPTITGYTIDPDSLIYGFMPGHDHTITITYSPSNLLNNSFSHTLTVNYILTGRFLTPFVGQIAEGQNYTVTPPQITYYSPNPSTVAGTMTGSDITETVYYKPNNDNNTNGVADEEETHRLNIYYIYNNGATARPTYSDSFLEGERYNIDSPSIPTYTPDHPKVTGEMGNKNKDITVIYSLTKDTNNNGIPDEQETYTLTIYYIKREGGTAHETYTKSYLQGERYDITSPTVTNYTPDTTVVYGTMPNEHKFITVIYTKVETTTSEGGSSSGGGSSGGGSSSSSTKSDLLISSYNEDITVDDWVGITISTNSSYKGKISFNKLQYQSTNGNWIDVSTTSKTYIEETSEEFDLGYKMTASDSGKKTIKNLIKFKISGKYRLYAEDKNGYSDYIQFYVDDETTTNNTKDSGTENNKENDKNNNSSTGNKLLNGTNQHGSYSGEVYTTRNCKQYNIQYDNNLDVYTSPNLKKAEYFISPDYLKRYIDSKNTRQTGCPANTGRTSTSYLDKSNSTDKYIAPNGKTYFILGGNGNYYSNQLSTNKGFSTLNEIKYYIRDHNPLIWTK